MSSFYVAFKNRYVITRISGELYLHSFGRRNMSINNIEKTFSYIAKISKAPIDVKSPIQNVYLDQVPDHIYLSQRLFYTDGCNMCGRCDVVETEVYCEEEYQYIQNCSYDEFSSIGLDPKNLDYFRSLIHGQPITVNDQTYTCYVVENADSNLVSLEEKTVNLCRWSIEHTEGRRKCAIHPLEPITCDMPHLRFDHVRRTKTTFLGLQQFGRNWNLHCPVVFDKNPDSDQFGRNKENIERKLKKLKVIIDCYNVDTYIDNILEVMSNITYDNYIDVCHTGSGTSKYTVDCAQGSDLTRAKHQSRLF